jgi:predicted ATP-grasp superfamily ATP-dependent carboligase
MKKVIVIGCHVNGYGVIRSLGQKGFKVIALHYDNTDFGHASKYVCERAKIPHPRIEEERFVDFLVRNSHKWEEALLVETNDDIAVSISKNKTELIKHYKILTPDWDVLRRLIEKPETYKLADKCNVPYPKTFLLMTLDELHEIKDEINYPCVLKPVLGYEFASRFNSKVFSVNNYDDLLSKFKLCLESGLEVMIQEIIPGPDSNIYNLMLYMNSGGNISARFLSKKIRQNPPQFGHCRVGISHNRIPEIEEFTKRLLKEVNFRGFASAEFKKDPRDEQFKLMEINGRMVRRMWLAAYCGVNFPWIIYMDLVEGKQIEVNDYKKSAYWIELYQDVSNSIIRHNKEELKFSDYLKPYLSKDKTFADLSRDDFMPFLKLISILPIKYYKSLTHIYRR